MVFIEDGAVLARRRRPWQKDILAFGWIDPRHHHRTGPCPQAVLLALEKLALRPVDRTRGFHACPYCPRPEGARWGFMATKYRTAAGEELELGSASIAVEVDGQTWKAPNLVVHYIKEHGYLPPDDIVRALAE